MKKVFTTAMFIASCLCTVAQVDTTLVYNTTKPYGTLDIRIAKSSTRYYYLQEGKTFAFRQSGETPTGSFLDMTSWDSSPYTQGNLREKNGNYDYFVLNYRLLLPQAYNKSYSPGYPIIIMMHGAGERGNCWDNNCYHADRAWKPNTNSPVAPTTATSKLLNNDHNLLHGGKVHLDARNLAGSRTPDDPYMPGRAFPGFVLFPQNLNGWDANTVQDAIRLMRLIIKKYNIDPDRIYIHGLSNGASGVYQALKRAPWLFAAALTMSAPDDGGITSKNLQSTIAHIPLWTFQGGQDTNPTQHETEGYVKKFRDAGADVRYSLYPNLGHGTWNTAYAEGDFFSWILKQNKSRMHLFAGSNAICLTNNQGVRMEVASGFRRYQWERNGSIISNATSSSYVATTTGSYRVRFSRILNPSAADWNQWSDYVSVVTQRPPQPTIEQAGTVLLKDLNYYGNARLRSSAEAAHYYWYKNGALVNLSGSVDDTVRNAMFYPGSCTTTACTNNGKYTLVTKTSDGCPSISSPALSVYFGNTSSVSIPAPTYFSGSVLSLTSAKLSWKDVSSNERGFEIWRRNATGTSYTKWEMRTLTLANQTSFTDKGLQPSTKYQYKIRAVGISTRSNYTPAASNAFLTLTTNEDTSAPTAPKLLSAKSSGIGVITLSWASPSDNTGIARYHIHYGGKTTVTTNNKTTFTIENLPINQQYNFTVSAEDLDGNVGPVSNAMSANTFVNGLYYEHSTGSWTDLDGINWTASPEYTGTVKNITLSPRTQEDYFNFQFDGFLYITTSGSYKFRTTSSDGSRVQIDNTIVVNNDGLHDTKMLTGATYTLAGGARKFNVKYFEYDGPSSLIVQYYGPDTGYKWINIPDAAFTSGTSQVTMASAEPAQIVEQDSTSTEMVVDVYPNPTTKTNINLMVDTPVNSALLVIILNFSGQEVYRGQHDSEACRAGLTIQPNEDIQQGIYVLRVYQGENVVTKRLIIRE
jgi:predicted esterase/chitodextrinase